MRVEFENFSVGYRDRAVLRDVSFAADGGRVLAIAGRNGAGKSTLLSCLGGAKRDYSGRVLLDGRELKNLKPSERARLVASLPQSLPSPHITVRELAECGRAPHLSFGGRLSGDDRAAVALALERAGMSSFADRFVDNLSGGEQRRAFFSLALAQDAPVLLLDEPTTHLDAAARFELLELVARERDAGRTVVVVLHELAEMLRAADDVLLLDGGAAAFFGSPAEFLARKADERFFGVRVSGDREKGYAVAPL